MVLHLRPGLLLDLFLIGLSNLTPRGNPKEAEIASKSEGFGVILLIRLILGSETNFGKNQKPLSSKSKSIIRLFILILM